MYYRQPNCLWGLWKVWAPLVAQAVKNLPAMQEARVWSLGREDPLEKGWLPTPVFLPGEFHAQRGLVGYSPWGCKKLDMTDWLTISLFLKGLKFCSQTDFKDSSKEDSLSSASWHVTWSELGSTKNFLLFHLLSLLYCISSKLNL